MTTHGPAEFEWLRTNFTWIYYTWFCAFCLLAMLVACFWFPSILIGWWQPNLDTYCLDRCFLQDNNLKQPPKLEVLFVINLVWEVSHNSESGVFLVHIPCAGGQRK
jgi:hypothetical protein